MNGQVIKPGESTDMSRDIRLLNLVDDLRQALDEQAREYAAERTSDPRQFEREVDAAKATLYNGLVTFLRDHEFFQLEDRHVAAHTGLVVKKE